MNYRTEVRFKCSPLTPHPSPLIPNPSSSTAVRFTDGPVTFKYLALIGGALMMVCGFFGVLGGLLNPLEGVIEAYVMLFGALIVAIELKNKLFKDEISDETGELIQQHKFKTILAKEAKFLTGQC